MQTHGFVHSYETFGTKDGPGIRFIYFLQGCHLRCLYCHNADTWNKGEKTKMTVDEAFHEIEKVKGFIKTGGVTVSGGEPLMQAKFVLELFKKCKEQGIHTCVDTNGYLFNDDIKNVLEITDLVLLDIKHINPEKYLKLTEVELEPTLQFMQYLSEINKPTWLRYVLVPGYTDDAEDLENWAKYVSQFKNVERVDILPFHQMGAHKWKEIGRAYPLENCRPADMEDVKKSVEIFKKYHLPLPDNQK